MFVVLEGVDGAGKSGLAAAVAAEMRKRAGGQVFRAHHSQLKQDPMQEYLARYSGYDPQSRQHVVADRLHWGELVYGPLYRGESKLSVAKFRIIEMFLLSRGAVAYNVTNNPMTILDRLRSRGEDYLREEHVPWVIDKFEEVARSSAIHAESIEVEGDMTDLVDLIVDNADYTARATEDVVDRFPGLIGSLLPSAVLAITPGASEPEGEFMIEALDSDWWRTVAVFDVESFDPTEVVDALYGPPVVAIGQAASEILDEYGVDHGAVPAPADIRKNHANRHIDYGRLIRDTATTKRRNLTWPN